MVLFKIRLDKVGILNKKGKDLGDINFIRSTCMSFGKNLTFRPLDQEVLFCMPQFIINGMSKNKTLVEKHDILIFELQ